MKKNLIKKDIKSCRVLVTPTSYAKNDPQLRTELEAAVGEVVYNPTTRPLISDELQTLLPGIDGYIAGLDIIDRAALETADRLQVIARYGVGVDNVDREAARARGIIVTNTPGANSVSVAELTLGLILSLARTIPDAVFATRYGSWPRTNGISLERKTIGLLGLGAVGKQVARRLAGFDCRIVAYDPVADVTFAREHNAELVPIDQLLACADFLSLHLPLVPETRGLVNIKFLRKMKPSAFIINTARGELIVEDDLYEALQNKLISGAALDVFTKEPPGIDNLLLSLPQVIITPHIASHTDGATNEMGWRALKDCLAVLSGQEPLFPA